MKKLTKILPLLAALIAFLSLDASAGLITYVDRGTFDLAAPGLPTEDFEEGNVAAGGVVGFPDPLDASTNNAVFSPGDILPGLTIQTQGDFDPDLALVGAGFTGIGNASKVIFANFFVDTLDLIFDNANAVGFDLFSAFFDSTIVVSVYGIGDTFLDSFNVLATGGPGVFFGVINDMGTIARINLSSMTSNGAEGVDNVSFGRTVGVPEPGTLGLLGAGLLVLAFRRKKAA